MLKINDYTLSARDIIFDFMEKHNIQKVNVYFNGQGDDGQIEQMEACDDDDVHVDAQVADNFFDDEIELPMANDENATGKQKLEDYITEVCYGILGENFAGWEDNRGSEGHFTFVLKDKQCFLNYGTVVVQNHEYKF